jgi:quercetin dioxygenase-like cupin family protein
MIGFNSKNGYTEILDGIQIKTLCHGDASLMTEFLLQKGAILPEHVHPNEQTGYLVKGKIRLYMGDFAQDLKPGDSWCIKENIRHKAEILEDSVAIEVFCPVRADYLKYLNEEYTT